MRKKTNLACNLNLSFFFPIFCQWVSLFTNPILYPFLKVDLAVGQIAEEAHLGINEVAVHSVIQEVARLETKEVDPEIATEMIAVHEAHTVEDTTDEVKEVMKGVTVMTGVTVKVTLISEAVQEEIQIESQLKNSANQIQVLVLSLISRSRFLASSFKNWKTRN